MTTVRPSWVPQVGNLIRTGALAAGIAAGSSVAQGSAREAEPQAAPQAATGGTAMVVADQHLAAEVGRDVLAAGGNAIDAAVAMGYALAVVEPCCGNLGGGGFMLIHLANGPDRFINFRERAPLKATPGMYLDASGNVVSGGSTRGYLAVAVAGTVAGLEKARERYGTSARAPLIAPAIALAAQGYALGDGDLAVDRRATALFLAQTWFARQPNVVADLTGYTARQVNNWCRGRARVPRWAAALAVVLGAHSPADIRRMVEGATIWADAGDTRGPPADGHPDIRGVQPAG